MTTKEDLRAQLLQYSKAILLPGDFHDELAPAVTGYADFLTAHFVIDAERGRTHIKTAHGQAADEEIRHSLF